MLIVGAGVIGTVYGAHLAAAGHQVSVLGHGPRTGDVAARGMRARDVLDGERVEAGTDVVPDASGHYDVVLVAVRRDQLASACADLAVLAGKPALVFFGNNPAGLAAIPGDLPGDAYLGFPGVGGVMADGTADYVRIRQQPTALQRSPDSRLAALESALSSRGFAIQRVADMDGWRRVPLLSFVACVAAAALPLRNRSRLGLSAENRPVLALMCQSLSAGRSPGCTARAQRGSRATFPSCTARCSSRWPSATGHGPCARRWGSCASPGTRGTPKPKCGPLAVTWQPGSPARPH